jgi:hypothetical protein
VYSRKPARWARDELDSVTRLKQFQSMRWRGTKEYISANRRGRTICASLPPTRFGPSLDDEQRRHEPACLSLGFVFQQGVWYSGMLQMRVRSRRGAPDGVVSQGGCKYPQAVDADGHRVVLIAIVQIDEKEPDPDGRRVEIGTY